MRRGFKVYSNKLRGFIHKKALTKIIKKFKIRLLRNSQKLTNSMYLSNLHDLRKFIFHKLTLIRKIYNYSHFRLFRTKYKFKKRRRFLKLKTRVQLKYKKNFKVKIKNKKKKLKHEKRTEKNNKQKYPKKKRYTKHSKKIFTNKQKQPYIKNI